jgi:hypothetical protein
LEEAKKLIINLRKRKLYKFVDEVLVPPALWTQFYDGVCCSAVAVMQSPPPSLACMILIRFVQAQLTKEDIIARNAELTEDDIIIHKLQLNYGMHQPLSVVCVINLTRWYAAALKDRNPVDNVHFFNPALPNGMKHTRHTRNTRNTAPQGILLVADDAYNALAIRGILDSQELGELVDSRRVCRKVRAHLLPRSKQIHGDPKGIPSVCELDRQASSTTRWLLDSQPITNRSAAGCCRVSQSAAISQHRTSIATCALIVIHPSSSSIHHHHHHHHPSSIIQQHSSAFICDFSFVILFLLFV